jgi:hypothetical protein
MSKHAPLDYLYIADHFAILARSSWRNYCGYPASGSLVGSARSLPEAIRIANSIMKGLPDKYSLGIRISDGAVAKQRKIDEQKAKATW